MTKEKIPSLTDKEWANQNELGTIEEVIEYTCGDDIKKVFAVAHIPNGESMEAIEAKFMTSDMETGKVNVDEDGFNRAKMKVVFKIDDKTLDSIYNNKSSDLRTQMQMLCNRACGAVSQKEIEHEKNSDSPVASLTT